MELEIKEPITSANIHDLNTLLDRVYEKAFYDVAKDVSRRGGSIDDAKDIAHDSILALHDALLRGRIIENEVAYIVAIARNMWSQRRKNMLCTFSSDIPEGNALSSSPTLNEHKLLGLIETSGRKCLELLSAFYFSLKDLKSIVTTFGFSSEHSASVQKYKCIEKLRDKVKQNSIAYEDFFE